MPSLFFTFTVPAKDQAMLLVVETTAKDQYDLAALSTGTDPDIISGKIKFSAATDKLHILAEAEGEPNTVVTLNFTTPAGTKIYDKDQEIWIQWNGKGTFSDDNATLPTP